MRILISARWSKKRVNRDTVVLNKRFKVLNKHNDKFATPVAPKVHTKHHQDHPRLNLDK